MIIVHFRIGTKIAQFIGNETQRFRAIFDIGDASAFAMGMV